MEVAQSTVNGSFGPQEQRAVAAENLSRVVSWIDNYDTKASVLLGVVIGMAGISAAMAPPPDTWTLRSALAALATGSLVIMTLMFVHLGNYPRLKRRSDSLLYFGAIAAQEATEFKTAFLSAKVEDHLDDLLNQCHLISEIADAKFNWLRYSYRSLLAAIPVWICCLYFFSNP